LEIEANGKTLDDIHFAELKLWQPPKGPRVNVDTVLLSAFARIKANETVIELGSAQGAISLILARKFPRTVSIKGLELQHELVELSRQNASENLLTGKVSFVQGDLTQISQYFPAGKTDVVVVNPPYFSSLPERMSKSYLEASARHDLSCSLMDVVSASTYLLKNRGRLYLIMKSQRLSELLSLLESFKIPCKRLRPVYPSPGKRSNVVLVQAAKNARGGMYLEAPLFISDGYGNYTPELLKAYTMEADSCL